MPGDLKLKGDVKQVVVGHVEHPNIKLEALNVMTFRLMRMRLSRVFVLDAGKERYLGKS